jgi:hypothetical protein
MAPVVKQCFHDYRVDPPKIEGWYIWRAHHKSLKDLTLIFLARLRERGAGYENVLSPEFDYWDGNRVILPKGPIEWAECGDSTPGRGRDLIEVVGVMSSPCPFCREVPIWRYGRRFIGAGPLDAAYFYLECCGWFNGFSMRMIDPRQLAQARNTALERYAG